MATLKGNELPKIVVKQPGPKAKEYLERDKKCFKIKKRWGRTFPLIQKEGKNAVIKDVDGNIYIDFAQTDYSLGPSPDETIEAIKADIDNKLLLMLPSGPWPSFIHAAEKIKEVAPGDLKNGYIMYPISGSETNEFAVECARAYQRNKGPIVLTYQQSFHGTTPGIQTANACGMYRGEGELIRDTIFVPYPYCYRCPFKLEYPDCSLACLDHLDWVFDTVADPSRTAAFIIEAIQSRGCAIPPQDYWPKLFKKCKEHDILIIDDEIMMGLGRTCKMWAIENWPGCIPDIMTMGKSLAGGAPLSAMIYKEELADAWGWGGGQFVSFGGNPIGAVGCVAFIETLQKDDYTIFKKGAKMGEHLHKRLKELSEKHEIIGDVRGMGAIYGIELVKDRKSKEIAPQEAREISQESFKKGLIARPYGSPYRNIIVLYPPLNTLENQVDAAIEILDEAMKSIKS
jgi:4-aminobutyrate aminotransferase-like enzyme